MYTLIDVYIYIYIYFEVYICIYACIYTYICIEIEALKKVYYEAPSALIQVKIRAFQLNSSYVILVSIPLTFDSHPLLPLALTSFIP
jgi:hypothetical protein